MHRDFRETKPAITDLLAALNMLMRGQEHRMNARIVAKEGAEPYLELMRCGGGYTRDCYEGGDYYAISQGVVRELRLRGYVEGRPQWGSTDNTDLRLTTEGIRYWGAHRSKAPEAT